MPDSHLLEDADAHSDKCENQPKISSESEAQSNGIRQDPGDGQSPQGEKTVMVNHF